MDIGMLWFDNDKQDNLSEKIRRAANYYRNKYGKTPNLCFVHPCMLPNPIEDEAHEPVEPQPFNIGVVEIRTSNTMLPNHFWIGVNRQESASAL